jgi:hypothetical protein
MKFNNGLGRNSPYFLAQGCIISDERLINSASNFLWWSPIFVFLSTKLASSRLSLAKNFEVVYGILDIYTSLS